MNHQLVNQESHQVLRVLRTLRFFRELRLMLDCVLGSVLNATLVPGQNLDSCRSEQQLKQCLQFPVHYQLVSQSTSLQSILAVGPFEVHRHAILCQGLADALNRHLKLPEPALTPRNEVFLGHKSQSHPSWGHLHLLLAHGISVFFIAFDFESSTLQLVTCCVISKVQGLADYLGEYARENGVQSLDDPHVGTANQSCLHAGKCVLHVYYQFLYFGRWNHDVVWLSGERLGSLNVILFESGAFKSLGLVCHDDD